MREIALAMSRTWPTVVDVERVLLRYRRGGLAGAVSVVVVVGVAGGGGLGWGWIRLRAGGS